jgi:hypothetical protein
MAVMMLTQSATVSLFEVLVQAEEQGSHEDRHAGCGEDDPRFHSLLDRTSIPPLCCMARAMMHVPPPKRPGDPNGNARRDEREQGFVA